MCMLVSVFRKRGLGLTMWSRPRGLTRQDLQALNIIIINETVYAFQACVRSGSKRGSGVVVDEGRRQI